VSKRQSVKTHKTDEVQGEGSTVVITAVKVKEIRQIRKQAKEEDFDEFEGGVSLLAKHVIGWNWVDDEGNPLPIPKDNPEVIDELTDEESKFLVDLMMGSPKGSNKES